MAVLLKRLNVSFTEMHGLLMPVATGQRWLSALEWSIQATAEAADAIKEFEPDDVQRLGAELEVGHRYGLGDYVPLAPSPENPDCYVPAPGTERYADILQAIQDDIARLQMFGR